MKIIKNKTMKKHFITKISTLFIILIPVLAFSQGNNFTNWKIEQKSNTTVYTPNNLKKGERYSITLFSANNIGGTHKNWMNNFISADEKKLGEITYKNKIAQEKVDILVTARKFKNVIGKKFDYVANRNKPIFESQFALYISQKIDNDKAGIMRANYSNMDIFKRYQYGLKEVAKIMAEQGNNTYLNQKLTTHKKQQQRLAKVKQKKIDAEKARQIAIERAEALRRTKPDQGLKLAQIETVLIDNQIDVLMGGFDTRMHLLLKDGWAYKMGAGGAEIPPADFNATYSKQYEPNRWSQWRKNAKGKYEKKNQQGEWQIIEGDKTIPGTKNETVSGNYGKHAGSSNFGSSSYYIKLFKDGRFERSSNILVSTNSIDGNYNIITSSGSNKDGTRTVSSGSSPRAVLGSNRKTNDGAKNTGTYKIDGYTIEMHYDNGVVRRELFCFDDPDKSAIIVDDKYYWISSK
ncbi:MAG: hypothetical protein L3J53_03630 [Proteobacteria bacterium]|nr:hypothetical protein [Pseudomonadota bacterium]